MSTAANKRRHGRAQAHSIVAHLRVDQSHLPVPVDNISMGGIRIRGPEWLVVGTSLAFDLSSTKLKKPLYLSGVVVDARGDRGVGIRFDSIAQADSDRLEQLIATLGGSIPPAHVEAHRPTERERQLESQVRALVMEVGRAQELLQHRERELSDARSIIAHVSANAASISAGAALSTAASTSIKAPASAREADKVTAPRDADRLRVEHGHLATTMAATEQRHQAEIARMRKEAQTALTALARLLEGSEAKAGDGKG